MKKDDDIYKYSKMTLFYWAICIVGLALGIILTEII